jgi:hypothetical protein
MRQLYKFGLAALLFGACAIGATAQENTTPDPAEREFSKLGAGSGTFLNLPIGARATALGSSYAGVADDATAMYWNPAGITQIAGARVGYSFGLMFAGINHHFAGVTFPVGDQFRGGISALSYGTDDIEETTMFNQEGTGATYRVRDLALGFSFAGQLTDQFSFGVTGKFINLTMASLSAKGIAFDFGTLYKPGLLGLRLGFTVHNLSGGVQYTGTALTQTGTTDQNTGNQNPDAQLQAGEASLPLIFRAGISSDLMEGDEANSLLVSTEFSTASDRGEYVGLGVEYVWNKFVAARVGYQHGTDNAYGLTGGIGLSYETGSFDGSIDYAVRPHKTLGLVQQITASVRLQ